MCVCVCVQGIEKGDMAYTFQQVAGFYIHFSDDKASCVLWHCVQALCLHNDYKAGEIICSHNLQIMGPKATCLCVAPACVHTGARDSVKLERQAAGSST